MLLFRSNRPLYPDSTDLSPLIVPPSGLDFLLFFEPLPENSVDAEFLSPAQATVTDILSIRADLYIPILQLLTSPDWFSADALLTRIVSQGS